MTRRACSRSPKYLSIGPVLRAVPRRMTRLTRFLLMDRPLPSRLVSGPASTIHRDAQERSPQGLPTKIPYYEAQLDSAPLTAPHPDASLSATQQRESAMPTKPKASAKLGAKAKREAIAKAFGGVPVDSGNIDFLYNRRHLATVRDGKWRELKYIVELDELEQVIWKTLDRIRKRDGIKIFKEVTDRIVDSVAVSIQSNEKRERSSTSR
jgi:hypothetical protein